jgi:hypothetical protein
MNFHTECCNILLFEFSREMSLDERGLEIALAIAWSVYLQKDEKVKRISTDRKSDRNNSLLGGLRWLTFPVPPSPTSTSLKLGICEAASAILLTASR